MTGRDDWMTRGVSKPPERDHRGVPIGDISVSKQLLDDRRAARRWQATRTEVRLRELERAEQRRRAREADDYIAEEEARHEMRAHAREIAAEIEFRYGHNPYLSPEERISPIERMLRDEWGVG